MSHYTEVPVVLRFRSQNPITYDGLRHRLQMCGMDDLAEFVIVERPKDVSEQGWTMMHKQMEAQNAALDMIEGAFRHRRPIDAPVESSPHARPD